MKTTHQQIPWLNVQQPAMQIRNVEAFTLGFQAERGPWTAFLVTAPFVMEMRIGPTMNPFVSLTHSFEKGMASSTHCRNNTNNNNNNNNNNNKESPPRGGGPIIPGWFIRGGGGGWSRGRGGPRLGGAGAPTRPAGGTPP